MRAFDVVLYGVLIAAILFVVYGGGVSDPAPERQTVEDVFALPPPSDLDPAVQVAIPDAPINSSGTAFSIGDGVWFTARHVVDGCDDVVFLVTGDQGFLIPPGVFSYPPEADVAVFRAPLARKPFPLDLNTDNLKVGDRGFHIGYPQGLPGEASSRLLGREVLQIGGRFSARAPVLAWAETGRTQGLVGTLGGMSGGPAFDANGEVVGVTIAEAPRRGRIYTAAPASLTAALRAAGADEPEFPAAAGELTPADYADVARRLRKNLRVAKLLCLVDG